MSKKQRGYEPRSSDDFKRQLVAESRVDGVTVPMVSKEHGVSVNRIYAWRNDPRFQANISQGVDFIPVAVSDDAGIKIPQKPTSESRIEIALENGRMMSVTTGFDAGFVLEIARGLAA